MPQLFSKRLAGAPVVAFALLGCPASESPPIADSPDRLDTLAEDLEAIRDTLHVPGLAAATGQGGEVVWQHTGGEGIEPAGLRDTGSWPLPADSALRRRLAAPHRVSPDGAEISRPRSSISSASGPTRTRRPGSGPTPPS